MTLLQDFVKQTFVQTLILELFILCAVIGVGTILTLFVLDIIDLLRKVTSRRK